MMFRLLESLGITIYVCYINTAKEILAQNSEKYDRMAKVDLIYVPIIHSATVIPAYL